MKRAILIILFSINFCNLIAQNDHLEPVDGFFNIYEFRQEYYSNINSILFKDLDKTPIIRYLVTPSFETEYAMQLEYIENDYYLVYIHAKKSIWYLKDKSKIEVDVKRKKIQEDEANLIIKLYLNATKGTKYIESDVIGTDGTTYIFSVSYAGKRSGETWSPRPGTKMHELVQVNEKIIKEVKNDTFLGLSSKLKNKLKGLSDKFLFSNEHVEFSLKKKVRDTIFKFLNKNLTIDSLDIKRTSGDFDYKYKFNHNGQIKNVIRQKNYGVKWIENWLWNYEERKTRKKIKNSLKNLDLSFLNMETELLLKFNISYDKKSKKLYVPKNYSWEK